MNHNFQKDKTSAGRAVQSLYRYLREDVETPDGSWNGADTVEFLCQWLQAHGFDVEGPNPWPNDDEEDDTYE